ncbi:hypothetical protein M422DRAFT_178546 [Sphaerobolus stellatus SS14]|uniref:Proteasome assembly chaperone 3 n=1 Tax=Sphaerobolus stellatus (strain SS14) TaxID=990650 RepID=A0A0C9VHL4_SPHS4|nr:hypothetical protein M422DRAFT_194321 [Sphaerobolus stellatus SS14]KIJ37035.1 hypothetical protein M422DRAFT_178546 [Sphaerobolus stellatus SS14]
MSLKSSSITRNIQDIETELVLQVFADRILLFITQIGKVGSLIQASIPPTAPLIPSSNLLSGSDSDMQPHPEQSLPSPPPSIQLTPLVGSAPSEQLQTLHSLYASQAATLVWLYTEARGGQRKPVVVGIALRKGHAETWDEDKQRKTFHGVMEMLQELLSK